MNKEIYTNTKDWIEKTTPKKDIQNIYKEFYTKEVFKFTRPKGDAPQWVDWVNPPLFGKKHKFDKAYVSMIKNGSIWMNQKGEGMVYVLSPEQKCFQDMVFYLHWGYFAKAASQRIPKSVSYHGRLGVLAWAGHTNYWHWLHDILGRYHLLQLSGVNIDKYVLPPLTKSFQWETIEMMGIPKNKIIQLTPGSHLKAENLILPSVPFNAGTCVKWTVEFIRKTFLKPKIQSNSSDFERIYISRRDASWRKVANEGRLMRLLSEKGFKRIFLSSLTVQQQIDIFSSAKVILGANGAGLANLMFCQPRTKVIQLFTSTSDEFIKIGQYLDLDYYLLKCASNPRPRRHEIMNNLIVDVNKLAFVLESEGIR